MYREQLGLQQVSSQECGIAQGIALRTAAAGPAGEPAAAAEPAVAASLCRRVDAGPLAGTSVVAASHAALGSGAQGSLRPGTA